MATAQTLFKMAAILNAIFVPAHVLFGLTDVHPAINTIPNTRQHRVGKRGAQNCYNYVNASMAVAGMLSPFPSFPPLRLGPPPLLYPVLEGSITDARAIEALLNWQWARTGGPKTPEEMAVFWAILAAGFWSGFRYVQVGEYKPLPVLVVAPTLSAAAVFML